MTKSNRPEVSIDELNVVLVGDFNPTIFQPCWFAHHQLLRQSEVDKAKVKIIHPDAAEFSLEWVGIQVVRERFTATIRADAYQSHLADLVLGTLALVSHTPVRQLGINLGRGLKFGSETDWHRFGHFLAPKSAWRGVLEKPGLRAISMQGVRPDDRPGYIAINANPRLAEPNCISLLVNSHFDMPKQAAGAPESAEWVIETIEACFNDSMQRAITLGDALIEAFCNEESVDDGTIA